MALTPKEEYENVKVKRWHVTDSDGTMVPFVPLEKKELAKLEPQELLKVRDFLIANPEIGFAVLTGRQNGEANNAYKTLMEPDGEGRQAKAILLTENGANLQTGQVYSENEMLNAEEHAGLHQLVTPLTETEIARVEQIMSDAAGEHYTNDPKNTSEEKWIRAEVKKFGFTAHYREPNNPEEKVQFEQVKEQIKEGFQQLGEETGLHVHLGATSSFTIEKVSKGTTIAQLAENAGPVVDALNTQGIQTDKPVWMSYSGDDTGDFPALKEINDRLERGEIKGVTTMPNNYTTFDPEGRTPRDWKNESVIDTLYLLGSQEKMAQEVHRGNISSLEASNQLSDLRQGLQDKGLMPSQNREADLPQIVVLNSGDILLPEPEKYTSQQINSLKDLDVKVVLMVAGNGPDSGKLKTTALETENFIAITPEGKAFTKGNAIDLTDRLTAAKSGNKVISKDPVRGAEMQLLRGVQEVLADQGLIKDVAREASQTAKVEDFKTQQTAKAESSKTAEEFKGANLLKDTISVSKMAAFAAAAPGAKRPSSPKQSKPAEKKQKRAGMKR